MLDYIIKKQEGELLSHSNGTPTQQVAWAPLTNVEGMMSKTLLAMRMLVIG